MIHATSCVWIQCLVKIATVRACAKLQGVVVQEQQLPNNVDRGAAINVTRVSPSLITNSPAQGIWPHRRDAHGIIKAADVQCIECKKSCGAAAGRASTRIVASKVDYGI